MSAFNPTTEYIIVNETIPVRDFHDYPEDYVVRPPYQRKNVWTRKKKQALLDSLFRRYYIPRIVIREIRLSEERTVKEVVDGQQRINTVQDFLADRLSLPRSLKDVHAALPGATYSGLNADMRRFVDRLSYSADIVMQIHDPYHPSHQKIATEIFWRLQQGESLTYMEVAHSRLASIARNFVVKHADDQTFDYDAYEPIDSNPDKHVFFRVVNRNNNRMQHLALLTRFLLIEEAEGPADIRDTNVLEYVERYQRPDGIGNLSMEQMPAAKAALRHMREFYKAFKDDPMVTDGDGMKELRIEYFIISMYLLLRHLLTYYVFGEAERALFRQFVIDFHTRWRAMRRDDDTDILVFSDNRQQTAGEIEVRDRIVRQLFFEYAAEKGHEMCTKDEQRAFSEAERIFIYRRDNGLCQDCLAAGKPEVEAVVPWAEYEADHVIPHSRGGRTVVENAQVLCRYHNAQKGATFLDG